VVPVLHPERRGDFSRDRLGFVFIVASTSCEHIRWRNLHMDVSCCGMIWQGVFLRATVAEIFTPSIE